MRPCLGRIVVPVMLLDHVDRRAHHFVGFPILRPLGSKGSRLLSSREEVPVQRDPDHRGPQPLGARREGPWHLPRPRHQRAYGTVDGPTYARKSKYADLLLVHDALGQTTARPRPSQKGPELRREGYPGAADACRARGERPSGLRGGRSPERHVSLPAQAEAR